MSSGNALSATLNFDHNRGLDRGWSMRDQTSAA
jgi:hypothetical protein